MLLEEQLVNKLKEKGYTLTTAESCTGGLLAGRILNVAGASEIYNEGHITYSNDAKARILGVKHETLERYGAVSSETAKEMAEGAAKIANAQAALSTTGIAGPGGGTPEKPVGLIYIGCSINGSTYAEKYLLSGNREENRNDTVENALKFLIDILSKN